MYLGETQKKVVIKSLEIQADILVALSEPENSTLAEYLALFQPANKAGKGIYKKCMKRAAH